jgi:glycine dehydrogenase subunit 1
MSTYIPNTVSQQHEMLSEIGVTSIDELFTDIPERVRLKRKLDLPEAKAEMELVNHMRHLSGKSINIDEYTCFLGAGAYDHYIPSVVSHMISRQEFYTAYTPYQPEISQGTLQAIFEYQTMICRLTGMDVGNASMYDGASALAEAASMACSVTRRKEILIPQCVHPESREVLSTYAKFGGYKVVDTCIKDGLTDISDIENKLSENTAAIIIQNPNFFGSIEDIEEIVTLAHKNKSLVIVSCDPISLAILKSPGEAGADIAVGEGQSLGNPLSFGGPHLGFFAVKKELMRKMPGRIVGETVDKNGKRGFVLTLQTREQHIRREKATSNICSNQSLNALTASIYLTTMGKRGLTDVALLCMQKAHYAYDQLIKTGLFKPAFKAPFFKEFALRYNRDVSKLNKSLLGKKIIGGYELRKSYSELKDGWLVAITEKRTKEDIDCLVREVASL